MAMSPRKRARVSRAIQYAVLAVVVLVAVIAADWEKVGQSFLDPDIIRGMFPDVITTALKNTLLYTACGFAFGLVLGLVLALMRLSPVGPYRWMATSFIEFFRGVPALVVFLALSVGVPTAFPGRQVPGDILGTATLALGLVGGAYMAETIRAGIQAVPKGQMEAARSLGMSHARAMVSIVIPQAFRIILPRRDSAQVAAERFATVPLVVAVLGTPRLPGVIEADLHYLEPVMVDTGRE